MYPLLGEVIGVVFMLNLLLRTLVVQMRNCDTYVSFVTESDTRKYFTCKPLYDVLWVLVYLYYSNGGCMVCRYP